MPDLAISNSSHGDDIGVCLTKRFHSYRPLPGGDHGQDSYEDEAGEESHHADRDSNELLALGFSVRRGFDLAVELGFSFQLFAPLSRRLAAFSLGRLVPGGAFARLLIDALLPRGLFPLRGVDLLRFQFDVPVGNPLIALHSQICWGRD
jgi:hypothetical protein